MAAALAAPPVPVAEAALCSHTLNLHPATHTVATPAISRLAWHAVQATSIQWPSRTRVCPCNVCRRWWLRTKWAVHLAPPDRERLAY